MRTSKSVSSKQVVKEFNNAMPDFIDTPSESCCGAACDTAKRDNELKLIGVREFSRLLQKTCMLTGAEIHCLNVVESEYNMLLNPLK